MSDKAITYTETPEGWVPADQRIGGFDRRTIWPGVLVLIIWLIWAHALPFVNSQIKFDHPTKQGDVINLLEGKLTLVPAEGWNLEDGVLLSNKTIVPISSGTASLSQQDISLKVRNSAFNGTAEELLDKAIASNGGLNKIPAKDIQKQKSITNIDGVPGAAATFTSYEDKGLIVTYVFDTPSGPVGVEAVVRVGPSADESYALDVAKMITSITYNSMDTKEAN